MQYFNFECYCENAQVLGFPDFKYSTLLGVTRQLVFFELSPCNRGYSYPRRWHAQTRRSLRGTGAAKRHCNSCARSSPLRQPREERTSVVDLTPLPRQRCGAAGGTILQEGIPAWDWGTTGGGTKSRGKHPKYYSHLHSTYGTEGSKPGKRDGRGAYAHCGQLCYSPVCRAGIPPSGDPLACPPPPPVKPRLPT